MFMFTFICICNFMFIFIRVPKCLKRWGGCVCVLPIFAFAFCNCAKCKTCKISAVCVLAKTLKTHSFLRLHFGLNAKTSVWFCVCVLAWMRIHVPGFCVCVLAKVLNHVPGFAFAFWPKCKTTSWFWVCVLAKVQKCHCFCTLRLRFSLRLVLKLQTLLAPWG